MDALAAYRAFLGLRTHTVGPEPVCPVWWGGGGGGGGEERGAEDFPYWSPGGRALILTLPQKWSWWGGLERVGGPARECHEDFVPGFNSLLGHLLAV